MDNTRLPTIFIVVTITIDAMGFGLIMPVMPDLIREVMSVDLADAALWGGILAAAFAVMQFLLSPTVGNLSDRFGRRPILLISMAALAVDYVIMALAGTIWLLLIGRIVAGIASATHATATAYIADITPKDERAQRFGLISAGFGIGFILGPALGGLLAGLDSRAPFYAAAALAGVNFLFGYFVVPESLPQEKRRAFDWRRANPLGGFLKIRELPGMGWLLLMLFFYTTSGFVYPAIWAFYTQAAFGWDSALVGLSLTVYGLATVVVQAGLIQLVIPTLGEVRTVLYALILDAVILVGFGLASEGWMVWALTPIAAIAALATPALNGLMSRKAGDDQQGELQGVIASLNAIAMVISPVIMTQVFFRFTRDGAPIHLPGAPFFLALILILISIGIFAMLLPGFRRESARR